MYGEPHRAADDRFVHAEALDDRTRPSEWTIRPHAHAALNHVFHVARGGGAMHVESVTLPFVAPCVLIVPAGVIHGFAWKVDSSGSVVTMATAYLEEMVRQDRDFAGMFAEAAVTQLSQAESADVGDRIAALIRELAWAGTGHNAAIRADMLGLLVRVLRTATAMKGRVSAAPGRHAALVARFRDRVESHFRKHEPMHTHAAMLGATLRQLRNACHDVLQQTPHGIVDQRLLLEAKRALLYSNLTVAEVAESLGFKDPAYFSRFFARNTGCSARAFRRNNTTTPSRG